MVLLFGFDSDGREMFFCADGGGAAISCDISCSSGV
jgi:hypothetical protein